MTSPAKSRSRSIAGIDPRMGLVVNDNTPPAFPGHELSDLDGVSRPPAAEAVLHYARLAQIASYPMAPAQAVEPVKAVPDMDALPEQARRRRPPTKTRTALAGICSVIFHVAVFTALLTTATVTIPDDAQDEAGDTLSVVMLGDSDADQKASGEKSEQPPKPDEVAAEAVQPDVVQPTTEETSDATPVQPTPSETPPVDTAQPVQPAAALADSVQPEAVQPTQPVTQASPETVTSAEPEVLAAAEPAKPDEPAVVQPMATEVQPDEVKPAEAPPTDVVPTATQPETVQPTETAEVVPPPQEVTPVEKPTPPTKQIEKPKDVVKKPPPKPKRVRSGSEGDSRQDATQGSSEGTKVAQSDRNSLTDGHRTGMGAAAEANYLGKVSGRLARCVRNGLSSEYRRQGASASVRLTSNANGNVISASMLHSSGVAGMDSQILSAVRGCDLPSLPEEWGKPTRTLVQPVEVSE